MTYKPRYFIEYDGKIYYKRKKEDQKAREYFPINKIIAIQITKGNHTVRNFPIGTSTKLLVNLEHD